MRNSHKVRENFSWDFFLKQILENFSREPLYEIVPWIKLILARIVDLIEILTDCNPSLKPFFFIFHWLKIWTFEMSSLSAIHGMLHSIQWVICSKFGYNVNQSICWFKIIISYCDKSSWSVCEQWASYIAATI